jgi:hypothetical protein
MVCGDRGAGALGIFSQLPAPDGTIGRSGKNAMKRTLMSQVMGLADGERFENAYFKKLYEITKTEFERSTHAPWPKPPAAQPHLCSDSGRPSRMPSLLTILAHE